MSSRFLVLTRAAGSAASVSILCLVAHAQAAPHGRAELSGWKLTGAAAVQADAGMLALPVGAQLSRVFGAGYSVTGRVHFEALLSAEPEDVVSVQVGGATLAFARFDERVVVFSAEREGLAEEPLLSAKLGSDAEAAVDVAMDALVDQSGATVRVEIAGRSVEWRTDRAGGESFEFALSAGAAGPLTISAFDFAVDRVTPEVVDDRATREATTTHAKSTTVEATPVANAARAVVAREESGSHSRGDATAASAALQAEPRSGAPPGGRGLEVFTPPSVRRHGPDANANERGQEVTP